jgi:nitroreductase
MKRCMDTIECIMTRRSIRKFKNLPIEWYKIGRILECGTNAPTAGNLQDFRLMVVTDTDMKRQVAMASLEQMWIAEAPFVIVVLAEFVKTKRFYGIRGERLYAIQDCAAAAQNILLAAHSMGLAACWVGAFDEDKVRSICSVPDYARPQVIIPIGYPDEEPPAPAKYKLENFIFFHRWADNSGEVIHVSEEMIKDWSPKVERTLKKAKEMAVGARDRLNKKANDLHQSIRERFK